MSAIDDRVAVTLRLPKETVERATRTATEERRRLEDVLEEMVTDGLSAHESLREILEGVSAQYRMRLKAEGCANEDSSKVLDQLRESREQVARELYP